MPLPSGETPSQDGADERRREQIGRRRFISLALGAVLAGVGAIVAAEESSTTSHAPPVALPPKPLPKPPPKPHGKVFLDAYYDSPAYSSKTAAIQAAYRAAAARNAVLECRAGRVYSLDTAALQLQPATPISIEGNGATFRSNWGKPRCIDFVRTADYQIFHDIEIRDLIFDANHYTSPTAESAVGNVVGGGGRTLSRRINATRITLRRCQWINVPYGTTVSYSCFALQSLHPAAGEQQTQLTDIRLEQCRMHGGNRGAVVIGGRQGGDGPVEVYHDRIYLDIDHDTGVVPASRGPTGGNCNAQIGSLGFGNYCEVHLIGANSADVGVEIDGMQNAVVYGRVTDARNAAFYVRNFHAPPHSGVQRIRFVKCESRVVNLNPDGETHSARGFIVGGSTMPNPRFNLAVLEDCSFYSAAHNFAATGQALYVPGGAPVNRVSVVGKFNVVCARVDEQPTVTIEPTVVAMFPAPAGFVFDVSGRISITIAGAGGAKMNPRAIWLSPESGCQMRLAVDEVQLSSSLTGISPGGTVGLLAGGTLPGGGTVSGYIRYLGWGSFSGGDTNPTLLYVSPSSLSSTGKLVVGELDLRHSPSLAPAEVRGASHAIKSGKIEIRHVSMPNASASGASFGM